MKYTAFRAIAAYAAMSMYMGTFIPSALGVSAYPSVGLEKAWKVLYLSIFPKEMIL